MLLLLRGRRSGLLVVPARVPAAAPAPAVSAAFPAAASAPSPAAAPLVALLLLLLLLLRRRLRPSEAAVRDGLGEEPRPLHVARENDGGGLLLLLLLLLLMLRVLHLLLLHLLLRVLGDGAPRDRRPHCRPARPEGEQAVVGRARELDHRRHVPGVDPALPLPAALLSELHEDLVRVEVVYQLGLHDLRADDDRVPHHAS
mmetsp:Transcript_8838/g.24957  ORF Transcript_8838/g.24957 Transcript_8838/m.24957 type:complete len:200 (-) Transcript_8838:480-1079(-)